MRSRIIVLLAVCSNVAVAGVLPRNGARGQHQNAARYLNHTETASIPADVQTLTPSSISSIIPSIVTSSEVTIFATTSSTIPTVTPPTSEVASSATSPAGDLTKSTVTQELSSSMPLSTIVPAEALAEHSQVGSAAISVSAGATIVQPTETLSRLFNLAGNPSNSLQVSIDAQSSSSTSSSGSSIISPVVTDISSIATSRNVATTSLSSTANQALSHSELSITAFATTGASKIMSPSTETISTTSPGASGQATSPIVVPVPVSSGPVQVLGEGGDTADEFAPVTLDTSLPAPTGTAKYPTAENGNTAMAAGFNNVYKTLNENIPCDPRDPSQAYACVEGEIAECQSDESYVLKSCPRGQSCYALPKPSGSTGVVVQCAVPSDAYSILAGLASSTAVPVAVTSQPAEISRTEGVFDQATSSVSVVNAVQPVTSSSSVQAATQSQRVTSVPLQQVVITTASPAQVTDQHDTSAVSTSPTHSSVQSVFQARLQTIDSALIATATAQPVKDSNQQNTSPTSDPPSSAPSTTTDVLSIPKALFGVITATPQASYSRSGNSIPNIQSSATSSQPTEANVAGTSTSSAADTGIVFAQKGVAVNEKLAVDNGQATVTVTVTVTTTERPAPVTVTAS